MAGGNVSITVVTGDDQETYLDDFYSCFGHGIYVANINGAFGAASALAHD